MAIILLVVTTVVAWDRRQRKRESFSRLTAKDRVLVTETVTGGIHDKDCHHHWKHAARPQGRGRGQMGLRNRAKANDAEFELVDIKDFNLPLLDEPVSPIMGQYSKPHTKVWAGKTKYRRLRFRHAEYTMGPGRAQKCDPFSRSPSGTTMRVAL